MAPFLSGKADVVYGSRFSNGKAHRVVYFWHMVGNRFLTLLSNMMTNLNLSDMETGFKMFRREVIQAVAIEERPFRVRAGNHRQARAARLCVLRGSAFPTTGARTPRARRSNGATGSARFIRSANTISEAPHVWMIQVWGRRPRLPRDGIPIAPLHPSFPFSDSARQHAAGGDARPTPGTCVADGIGSCAKPWLPPRGPPWPDPARTSNLPSSPAWTNRRRNHMSRYRAMIGESQ